MHRIKLFLLFVASFSILNTFAQPTGLLDETFNLKYLSIVNFFYTPNGENPDFTISENAGNFFVEANGISNLFSGETTFNSNTMTFQNVGITLNDCTNSNCYYEDLYFYDILTTPTLESKTFIYYYIERNGFKYLSLRDSEYNWAEFSTEPAPEPNPLLFQTWYLYRVEVDLGEPTFYTGPNPPQITIDQDLTYNGVEDCALISGDFILGNGRDYYDFILQSQNYLQDETNCTAGNVDYAIYELSNSYPLGCILYQGNDGVDYFQFETAPGFISYFRNALILSAPENNLSHWTIFPNPTQDKLIIQSPGNDFESVSITDINGRIVTSILNYDTNEIDVSNLKSGIYFINIKSSEGSTISKFIKN